KALRMQSCVAFWRPNALNGTPSGRWRARCLTRTTRCPSSRRTSRRFRSCRCICVMELWRLAQEEPLTMSTNELFAPSLPYTGSCAWTLMVGRASVSAQMSAGTP
ncbi:par-5, partial [Symbiodinium sp. KB8]